MKLAVNIDEWVIIYEPINRAIIKGKVSRKIRDKLMDIQIVECKTIFTDNIVLEMDNYFTFAKNVNSYTILLPRNSEDIGIILLKIFIKCFDLPAILSNINLGCDNQLFKYLKYSHISDFDLNSSLSILINNKNQLNDEFWSNVMELKNILQTQFQIDGLNN